MESKYEAALARLTEIRDWAAEGLLDKEIAAKLGCSPWTLGGWKHEHPEIAKAIKEGRAQLDNTRTGPVEDALLKRALGYEYVIVKTVDDPQKGVREETTTYHMPPDVTAIIFYLANRMPDRWKRYPEGGDPVAIQNQMRAITQMLDSARKAAAAAEPASVEEGID